MRKPVNYQIGPINREIAVKIDSIYVKFVETNDLGTWDHIDVLQNSLKRGQLVLTISPTEAGPIQFIIAKVSSVRNNTPDCDDGPVIRVTDNKFSWRVDGDKCCVPTNQERT